MLAAYILLSIFLLLSIAMILKPSIFTRLNIIYFRTVFKLWGYDIELKPISPGRPEKFAKIWGLICTLFVLCFLILVYLTTKP